MSNTGAGPLTRFKYNYALGVIGQQGLQGNVGPAGAGTGSVFVPTLRSTAPALSRMFQMADGYAGLGDGGEGQFFWNSADTRPDDGGTILSTGGGSGRWNRVQNGITSVTWFGAVGDEQRVTDGAMSLSPSDPTLLGSASGKFKPTDVGKLITVGGAGAAGATLATTIASYVSPTQVHTTAPAVTAVTGAIVTWGTNNRPAINATIASIKASNLVPGLFSASSTLYFPPGGYMVDQAIVFDASCSGIQVVGASQGKAGPVPVQTTKITLGGNDTAVIKNTSASNTWRNIWFSGGRVASRAVIDFEYFADHQSFYDCTFDAPASSGVIHWYGQDNGALQIDNIKFWNCFLFSDLFDASWVIQTYVWNVNGNAFQIDYYGGFWEGTVVYGMYFAQGSVNLHGTQVYGWLDDFLHIYGNCAYTELEDVYTEQTTGNFINQVDNGTGVTTDDNVVLRRCHLNAPVNIVWGNTQPLVLEDTESLGLVLSHLSTPINKIYDYKPIICRNLRFNGPNAGFDLQGGSTAGTHVLGDWYNLNTGTGSLCTDGAINSGTNALTSPGNHFSAQDVGFKISIPGAGPSGAALVTRIKSFDNAGQVRTVDNASTSVSGKTITNTGEPFRVHALGGGYAGIINTAGYDADGWLLAVGSYQVPIGLGIQILAADTHLVLNLTADRATTITDISAQPGQHILVSRVGATDTHKYSITYSLSSPQTISLVAGQWAEFLYVQNSGLVLIDSGSTYSQGFAPPMQTGTVTLVNGVGTINTGITITANSQVHFTRLVAVGVSGTVEYQALTANMAQGGPGTGSFAVVATQSGGGANATDDSTLGYVIFN